MEWVLRLGEKTRRRSAPASLDRLSGAWGYGEDISGRPAAAFRMGHPPGFTEQTKSANELIKPLPVLAAVPTKPGELDEDKEGLVPEPGIKLLRSDEEPAVLGLEIRLLKLDDEVGPVPAPLSQALLALFRPNDELTLRL